MTFKEHSPRELPILDLSLATNPAGKAGLLDQLHDALFNIGFLYIKNHGVPDQIISALVEKLPALFDQPSDAKARLSKQNSPHFLGYSGYAEEVTLGEKDLREQFDFATELPVIWRDISLRGEGQRGEGQKGVEQDAGRDFTKLYWRLRGPNQWPSEELVPGFRKAFSDYHDALQKLSYRFVHLVEEAFGIPVGTFDDFFQKDDPGNGCARYLPPQHRIKLIKYPASKGGDGGQGVGAHKDSSGWLTFLYQVGQEEGLEVLAENGDWIAAPPIEGTFVVNFGNAFEAATEGAVKATVHRVKARPISSDPRYSIPFFQGLPLDLTVSEIRSYIPQSVRRLKAAREASDGKSKSEKTVSTFLDARWDNLGESQLRKWIKSHENAARKWYDEGVVNYYLKP